MVVIFILTVIVALWFLCRVERLGVSGGQGHYRIPFCIPPNIVRDIPRVYRHFLYLIRVGCSTIYKGWQRYRPFKPHYNLARSLIPPFYRWRDWEVDIKWIVQCHTRLASGRVSNSKVSEKEVQGCQKFGKFSFLAQVTTLPPSTSFFLLPKHRHSRLCKLEKRKRRFPFS